jgi:hypothetical protein
MPTPRVSYEDLHEWVSFEDPDEDRTWVFDVTFLTSSWACIFGRGCPGVLTGPAPELEHGCCSYGAHFTGDEDRERVEGLAAELTPAEWQLRGKARCYGGIARQNREGAWVTRLVDGACILLNRADFPGGAGCALHRAALERGERPLDWKPDVCWQVPLRRVDETDDHGHVTSTLREWKRRDWGPGGFEFHWWCTDAPDAFGADHRPVWRGMRDELVAMVGPAVYDLLATYLDAKSTAGALLPHPAARRRAGRRRQPSR